MICVSVVISTRGDDAVTFVTAYPVLTTVFDPFAQEDVNMTHVATCDPVFEFGFIVVAVPV